MSVLKAKRTRGTNQSKEEAIKEVTKEPIVRLNINLPESLHLQLKILAAKQRTDMTQIVIQLIREHLGNHNF